MMPVLPSGHVVGISSERARYHAVRQNIRISKDSPHHELYKLVDIIYANASDGSNPWHEGYRFTGYTISDKQWLKKWKLEDRNSFLEWLEQGGAINEIEGARNKIIYDTLPHTIKSFTYPERLYSILKRRVAAMSMTSATPQQWRNTIINMRQCGVREEEVKWSGVIDFLDEAQATGRSSVTRKELLTRIDYSNIRLELVNELVREETCHLHFQDIARIITPENYYYSRLRLGDEEYAVLRFLEPNLNYQIAYIGSQRHDAQCARRWLVLDPFGKAFTDNCSDDVIYYPDATSAKEAASSHAQQNYGLKSPLRPSSKYEHIGLHGGKDYREWILMIPDYQESYFTPHFTERNILLHMRTRRRIDSNGKKLLFVEEIQSDWHQQHTRKRRLSRFDQRIPVAPFQKEWTLLAIKLLLQHAIEGEYDGIAWAPGYIHQINYQSDVDWLLRLYDKVIPQHLIQLSRDWGCSVDKTEIRTRAPWLAIRRTGDYWSVSDREAKFKTGSHLTREQAIAIRMRHSKEINLEVPVFYIPDEMRRTVESDALPLFGENLVDRVKKPLCGDNRFKSCDTQTKNACLSRQ